MAKKKGLVILLLLLFMFYIAPKFAANVTYFQGEPIEIEYTFNPTTGAEAYIDECYECNSSFVNIGGDTLTGTLNSQTIIPTVHNTYDLGSSAKRWQDIYTTDVYANYLKSSTGAQVIGLNTGNPIIFGNLLPSSTGTYNLGTTNYLGNSYYWKNLYMIGTLYGNDINATGNITAQNVFIHAYVTAHTNATIAVGAAGTWYNITFNQEAAPLQSRITHAHDDDTNDTFTIQDTGIYLITYSTTYQDSAAVPAPSHSVTRVTRNGVELNGFTIEQDLTKQNSDVNVHHSDLVSLTAGDGISLQFTGDETTISLTSHLTYGIHQNNGHITIERRA